MIMSKFRKYYESARQRKLEEDGVDMDEKEDENAYDPLLFRFPI